MNLQHSASNYQFIFRILSSGFVQYYYCCSQITTWQQIPILRIMHDLFILFLTVAVITPLTYTAYLGQPAVRFQCTTVHARGVAWSIDGFIRHGNELEARVIKTMTSRTLLKSNLTISSVLENNNTHIHCLAHHLVEHRFITSDEAIFHVQGQLPTKYW